MSKYERVWLSPEAKRRAKSLAASEGKTLKEWLDNLVLKDKEKGLKPGGDYYRFF